MKNGYAEAEKIERQINKLLEADPITKENALEWLKFARTIETTMTIIREHGRDLRILNPKPGDDPTPTLSAIKRAAELRTGGCDKCVCSQCDDLDECKPCSDEKGPFEKCPEEE